MINYVITWIDVTGRPMGVQWYEYKKDAMQAVAHFVSLGYQVQIQKPTF